MYTLLRKGKQWNMMSDVINVDNFEFDIQTLFEIRTDIKPMIFLHTELSVLTMSYSTCPAGLSAQCKLTIILYALYFVSPRERL